MQMTMIMFEKKIVFVVAFIQTHLNLLTAVLLPACPLDCMRHAAQLDERVNVDKHLFDNGIFKPSCAENPYLLILVCIVTP